MPPQPLPHADASPLRILLVAHTHWDREWYHPAARFRQRLVALVDALLDGARTNEPFLLDGQAITLVDYLSVRPDREPELRAALRRGAVEAGPWFVLADNLIPSGEAVLRNLEAGRRVLDRLGGAAPPVAYCPDSFGHPAALPMVAAGYGLPLAVVWRGLGGARHPRVDTLWWQHASGARVLVHHLPRDGYEAGSTLPVTRDAAVGRWSALTAAMRERNTTGAVLLTSGADHHARQTDLHRAVDLARDLLPEPLTIERTSLRGASQRIVEAAAAIEAANDSLPVVSGELRDSYGYTWTLQGTFGTRAHQKRANAMLERGLLQDVEPWLALAHLHAGSDVSDGRITRRHLPALLAHAWETLLATHAHDTLCGCSVDDVARAMDAAQASVATQVVGLRIASLEQALRHDPVAARGRRPQGSAVIVRNRCSYPRGGVAELRLDQTVDDVAVGPGSAGAATVQAGDEGLLASGFPAQEGTRRLLHRRRESPQHYPDDDVVMEHRVIAWVATVPAFGLRLLDAASEATGAGPSQPVEATEGAGSVVMSNGLLDIRVDRDGVIIRQGARELRDAISIETVRDAGDSYTPSPRGRTERLQLRRACIGARGPLRASVVLEWRYRESSRADTPSDLNRHAPAVRRRRRSARVDVRTTLILDADAGHVRCDVVVRNRMRDHRLQLVWHSDVGDPSTVRADAAFGCVERTLVPASAHAAELPTTTMPLHRWASTSDGERGAAMLSDGLAEGEVVGGRLAVTLVRSIGELSRADLPERPGHAGWPEAVPAAQSLGMYRARVGLLLHGAWSDDTESSIERAADALLIPLAGNSWRDLDAAMTTLPGPELVGDSLRMSAVALSRDGNALLLRARNLADRDSQGAWILPGDGSWRVTECRLDETPLSAMRTSASRVEFTVPPKGLTTLRIERAGD